MRLIGHRGCPTHAPENTTAAVRRAAPHVDAVEVDARRCATGEVVVFHDETVDELTRASGRVDRLPWSRLRALRVRRRSTEEDATAETATDEAVDPAGDDEDTIPLLSDLLAAVPGDLSVVVELKVEGLADDVVPLARDADPDVLVSSFEPAALREVRDRAPDLPVAPLFVDDWDHGLALARDLDADAVHPHVEAVGAERVAAAHDAGLSVDAWTVRSADEVAPLRAAGVDGVIADSWTVLDG
jgi:glycerophosphoryl diester phosphodiesterase